MAGLGAEAEAYLVATVQDNLAVYLYDNARFLAERLVASFRTEVRPAAVSELAVRAVPPLNPVHAGVVVPLQANVLLLATCYFHCNQAYRAYHLLTGKEGFMNACQAASDQ